MTDGMLNKEVQSQIMYRTLDLLWFWVQGYMTVDFRDNSTLRNKIKTFLSERVSPLFVRIWSYLEEVGKNVTIFGIKNIYPTDDRGECVRHSSEDPQHTHLLRQTVQQF